VEDGLWELVAAGLVTADGFENLRSLVDPKRRRGEGRGRHARPRHAAGRWALVRHSPESFTTEKRGALFADQLLLRWGVLFRDLLARESLSPPWRDLLPVLRRKEAQGEIRGGRFVAGFSGEQFALPEGLELLRAMRRSNADIEESARVSNADPLNLAGIILPGPRVSTLLRSTG
jgi:ATP-dependent Lhr-like helicase